MRVSMIVDDADHHFGPCVSCPISPVMGKDWLARITVRRASTSFGLNVAAAVVVVLIMAAMGYSWSGIFGLIAGVALGIVLATVLCGLLALLINIRDLLAESLTHRG